MSGVKKIVNIVCSDPAHPVMPYLERWREQRSSAGLRVRIVSRLADLDEQGDFLFLISCHEIVSAALRERFSHVLVIHASDLPKGRGWSPLIWQVLEGKREVTVTLLAAAERVDAGAIWAKRRIRIEGHETLSEINPRLFDCELQLMNYALECDDVVEPQPQEEHGATYYPKRRPEDSRLDPNRTIAEQFDLLRVADSERYPCFFDHRGHRYTLVLEKKTGDTPDGEKP